MPQELRYDNPENLSSSEINRKTCLMGHGPNRNKRCSVLFSYSTNMISTEEWVKKYC
jgi:hypothetical protein